MTIATTIEPTAATTGPLPEIQEGEEQRLLTFSPPVRSFEGKAKPHEPFWRFVNKADSESGQAELELYGVISEYAWFDDDITPRMFKEQLYQAGNGGPILMRVDSPGGDPFAASVIRSILMDYPGEVTAKIEGMAASAAVTVVLGADKVQILDSAYMMIHDPYFAVMFAILTVSDLERWARALTGLKEGMVDAYVGQTGLKAEEVSRMMADETWMSARQAVNYGFADEVVPGGDMATEMSARNVAVMNCLNNYAHVPPAIKRAYSQLAPERNAAEPDPEALDALRGRVQSILKENK